MEITTERKGEVLVALTEDRVDGSNAREFQEAVQAAIAGEDAPVVLDMERLVYISSAGLRVILMIARALQGESRNFAVCSLVGPVREVFEISGFDKIIQTHDTQEKAVAAVQG
ncbi:MAG: STAS domain-containing protein [Chloroflexi bacterium]|nr:STAS domain-containing protein [Chloroflexota bacterium]